MKTSRYFICDQYCPRGSIRRSIQKGVHIQVEWEKNEKRIKILSLQIAIFTAKKNRGTTVAKCLYNYATLNPYTLRSKIKQVC